MFISITIKTFILKKIIFLWLNLFRYFMYVFIPYVIYFARIKKTGINSFGFNFFCHYSSEPVLLMKRIYKYLSFGAILTFLIRCKKRTLYIAANSI